MIKIQNKNRLLHEKMRPRSIICSSLRQKTCLLLFLALSLTLSACGHASESSAEMPGSTGGGAGTAESGRETLASDPHGQEDPTGESPRETLPGTTAKENDGDDPEEDPWAEGYYFDEELTAALWERFATDYTNNTDMGSPSRTMTEEFLGQLDEMSKTWLYHGASDSDTEKAMLDMHFQLPDDPAGLERGLQSVKAAIYSLRGNDPDTLQARILLGNTEPTFYLFMRAYYSEAEEKTRVYMINGLVW